MAGIKELDDVSSAIMCMDTLAMDSMDMYPVAFGNVEAPPELTGAQSKERSNADSGAGKRAQQDKDDIQEIEDPVGTGAQGSDSSEAIEIGYDDDEDLMTDPGTADTHGTPDTPGTLQEVFSEDAHELDKTKDMNMDMTENDLKEEACYGDEGLMTDSGTPDTPDTPGTPQEEFAQDVDEVDETKNMNLDEAENDSEEEKGYDDEALDSDPGTPQEEAPEDVNELDELDENKDMNVDGAEKDLEVLGEGEKSLDSEKFVAPFPITRVKRIIKLDKDVRLVSSDAIALIAQATALFVQSLSSASFTVMLQTKRKTIRGPDVVLAAKSTRQFRECLGSDLVTLLEESNEDTLNGEDGLVEKEHGTDGESARKKPQQQKSAKKHQLAPPPGSRPITNFFKA